MRISFDTNIFIAHPAFLFPARAYLSSVVLTELLAGAKDAARIKELQIWRHLALRYDRFLVPTAEDWWETGKALQRLSQGSKRENFGATPRISPEERHRLFNDVLLAVSCRRAGITLITDNLKDFERIATVCRIKFSSGDAFFTPPDVSA